MTGECSLRSLRPRRRSTAMIAVGLCLSLLGNSSSAVSEAPEPKQPPNCQTDAMLVFDASGSMAGMGFGENTVTRIEQVRRALATVLASVAPVRNLGLITFGPGTRRECDNIQLRLRPAPNAAERIMEEVDSPQPYGQTPITKAVGEAADALNFRTKPAVIVLLTDDEENLRRQFVRAGAEAQERRRRRDGPTLPTRLPAANSSAVYRKRPEGCSSRPQPRRGSSRPCAKRWDVP